MPEILSPANEVCEGYVFTGVCLSTGGLGLCPGGGVSVQGISVWVGLCLGLSGFCSGWSLSGALWFLFRMVSVQRCLCLGVSLPGGSSPKGSLSRGISVWRGLCHRPPPSPYGNVQAVHILLECILVVFIFAHYFSPSHPAGRALTSI